MDLEAKSREVLARFTEEGHVRQSLEGRKYLTPFVVGLLVECAGKENIFTSGPELEKHSADHSHHLPCLPEAVIYPRSTEMVSEVMKICHRQRVPVTPCGARTGLEGGCIPLGGVSLDLSKMNQVLKLHREELQVHVQAGIKKEMLNDYLEPQGLFFQVDPASNPSLGGMAACGSSGTLCCNYGTMKENVVSLTVVLADGTVISTRRGVRKNSTGYDLTHLCMGQEGTLAVIAELVVKVTPLPKGESSLQVAFRSLQDCSRAVLRLREARLGLSRCELLNRQSVESLNAMSAGKPLEVVPTLFLQVHAISEEAAAQEVASAQGIVAECGGEGFVVATGKEDQKALWDLRRAAYYACQKNRQHMVHYGAKDIRMLSTDVCVPLGNFPRLIEETEQDYAATARATKVPLLCNIFGHAADGNFHCVVLYDHDNVRDREVLEALDRRMWSRCLALGGSVSGEHGCGMGKVPALQAEWGAEAIALMWRLKKCLDEQEILNPGKLLPARGRSPTKTSVHVVELPKLVRRSRKDHFATAGFKPLHTFLQAEPSKEALLA
ncbi:unnamed protein product [Effrenium voratum]|uniref:D-lactate dehydrogenase (cytochrome) n=1 Tax=Effrenium voratum TaxID=2562239 RepID=A0AA36IV22_9DINO|nr:unnamed protein product [Effrenium voratum]